MQLLISFIFYIWFLSILIPIYSFINKINLKNIFRKRICLRNFFIKILDWENKILFSLNMLFVTQTILAICLYFSRFKIDSNIRNIYVYSYTFLLCISFFLSFPLILLGKIYKKYIDLHLNRILNNYRKVKKLYECIIKLNGEDKTINSILNKFSIVEIEFLKNTLKTYVDINKNIFYAFAISSLFFIAPISINFLIPNEFLECFLKQLFVKYPSYGIIIIFFVAIIAISVICFVFIFFYSFINDIISDMDYICYHHKIYDKLELLHYRKLKQLERLDKSKNNNL